MEWRIEVKFLKAMYPYNEGDVGFVKQQIVDEYPDHVQVIETVKTKKESKALSEPVADKMIEKPIADKSMKKKSTK